MSSNHPPSKSVKQVVRINPNEALVVAKVETWEHVIAVFERLSEDASDRDRPYWLQTANTIRKWLDKAQDDGNYKRQ